VTHRYLQLIVKTGYDSVSMKGNAKKQRESDLYKHALREAREHLARWERLGKQLERTDDPGWQYVHLMRQAAVKQLELLIKMRA
jgi:hypothetical protein